MSLRDYDWITLIRRECRRCSVNCLTYVTGSPPTKKNFLASHINIDDIERFFSYVEGTPFKEIEERFREVANGVKDSPISDPGIARKFCTEALGIYCCKDPVYKGYIFYNTDRIMDYARRLSNSVFVAAINTVESEVGGIVNWLKRIPEGEQKALIKVVEEVTKSVVTTSIILHERFHWVDISTNKDLCDENRRCEEEARATAFAIKGTVDIIRGEKTADWQRVIPVNGLQQPHIENVLRSWRHERSYSLLLTLLAYELSVEAIALHKSKLPCYGDFHKFLGRKIWELGSVSVRKIYDTHWEVVLPWIGVSVQFYARDFLYAHLIKYKLVNNLELNLAESSGHGTKKFPEKVRVEELKEVWGYCMEGGGLRDL